MKILCFGSGSSGNCSALVNDKGKILIVDAGIEYMKVLKGLDYRISDVVGVLVTHEHTDHAKYVQKWLDNGVKVYMPKCMTDMYDRGKYFVKAVTENKPFELGDFRVIGFSVPHDETYCLGYLIFADEHRILWLTDLEYCPFVFKGQKLDTIVCEANYDMQYVDKSVPNWKHILKGHMSIGQTVELIQANQTDSLRTVLLAHLSPNNSNKVEFIDQVRKIENRANIEVMCDGLVVDLDRTDRCPF